MPSPSAGAIDRKIEKQILGAHIGRARLATGQLVLEKGFYGFLGGARAVTSWEDGQSMLRLAQKASQCP